MPKSVIAPDPERLLSTLLDGKPSNESALYAGTNLELLRKKYPYGYFEGGRPRLILGADVDFLPPSTNPVQPTWQMRVGVYANVDDNGTNFLIHPVHAQPALGQETNQTMGGLFTTDEFSIGQQGYDSLDMVISNRGGQSTDFYLYLGCDWANLITGSEDQWPNNRLDFTLRSLSTSARITSEKIPALLPHDGNFVFSTPRILSGLFAPFSIPVSPKLKDEEILFGTGNMHNVPTRADLGKGILSNRRQLSGSRIAMSALLAFGGYACSPIDVDVADPSVGISQPRTIRRIDEIVNHDDFARREFDELGFTVAGTFGYSTTLEPGKDYQRLDPNLYSSLDPNVLVAPSATGLTTFLDYARSDFSSNDAHGGIRKLGLEYARSEFGTGDCVYVDLNTDREPVTVALAHDELLNVDTADLDFRAALDEAGQVMGICNFGDKVNVDGGIVTIFFQLP